MPCPCSLLSCNQPHYISIFHLPSLWLLIDPSSPSLCAGVFLGYVISEVFKTKFASHVVYGVVARYLIRQRERRFIGLGGEEIRVLSSIRSLLCAGVFLGSAIFEVFESKLASRVAYGISARYHFRQRKRRFIGLSGRRRKYVFLAVFDDRNGHLKMI